MYICILFCVRVDSVYLWFVCASMSCMLVYVHLLLST